MEKGQTKAKITKELVKMVDDSKDSSKVFKAYFINDMIDPSSFKEVGLAVTCYLNTKFEYNERVIDLLKKTFNTTHYSFCYKDKNLKLIFRIYYDEIPPLPWMK